MEQLPYDIEQKLENLPVISFDNPDELQKRAFYARRI